MYHLRKTGLLREVCLATYVLTALNTHAMGQAVARTAKGQQQSRNITYAPGQIDLGNSRVYVYVGKTGLGHEHGVVGRIRQGAIQLGADQNAGQIVFDMASFEADTAKARKYVGLNGSTEKSTKRKVNANMRGPGVLDIRQYPTALFTVRSSRPLSTKSERGFPQYRLDGKLTLHGVAQPVRITVDAEPKDGWIHLRGGFSMLQTSYGITPFSKAFGAVGITDQLKIWGDIWIAGPRGGTVTIPSTQ